MKQLINSQIHSQNSERTRDRKPDRARKAAVLVLGMHRSGTSALTRVLNLLGCVLPKNLMPAGKGNELGHWESESVRQFNDRLLKSAGTGWNDWTPIYHGWKDSPVAGEFYEEAQKLLTAEFGSARLFALKDPRICRIPDFWLAALSEFGAQPIVVFALRNPLEVAASLERRDGLDPSVGQLLWLRHVLTAEQATRDQRRCFIAYDNVLKAWGVEINRLQKITGLSLPRLSDSAVMEIERFISESHRNERVDTGSVVDNPIVPIWTRETYDILKRWADGHEDKQDFITLDRIFREFDAATPAFSRPILAAHNATSERRKLEHELSSARAQLISRDEEIAELKQNVTAARGDVSKLGSDLQHAESALRQRQHESEQRMIEANALRDRLTVLLLQESEQQKVFKEAEATFRAELKEKNTKIEDLERQLDHLKQLGDDTLIVTREELEYAKQELARKKEQVENLKGDLDSAKGNLERAKLEIAGMEQKSKAAQHMSEKQMKDRFNEIAMLTKMIQAREERAIFDQNLVSSLVGISLNGAWLGGSKLFQKLKVRRWARTLERMGFFDRDWYLANNPDVKAAGVDPSEHYVRYGAKEGRLPRKF